MLTSPLHTITWQSPEGSKELAYRQWGEPDNPHVLLCVHGLTRNGGDFETLAKALQDKVRVVAPDMPGRGQSDWFCQSEHYAIPVYVLATLTLIAHLKPTTLDWLGTSMGGLIGIGYCSLPNTNVPCSVRKLILNDVGPVLELEALSRISQYVSSKPRFNDIEAARNTIRTNCQPFGPHTEAQWKTIGDTVLVREHGLWTTHHDPAIGDAFKQASTKETIQNHEAALWTAYDNIQADTLLLRGEHSDLLTVKTVAEMALRGPKPSCIEIKGVGHAPTFMQRDQIQVISDFLF